MPFRDNNEVNRCLGINVSKGNDFFILMKDFTGHFASYNLTENTITFHFSISSPLVFVPLVFVLALLKHIPPVNIVGDNSREVLYLES